MNGLDMRSLFSFPSKAISSRSKRSQRKPRRRSRLLGVEPLEGRRMLSATPVADEGLDCAHADYSSTPITLTNAPAGDPSADRPSGCDAYGDEGVTESDRRANAGSIRGDHVEGKATPDGTIDNAPEEKSWPNALDEAKGFSSLIRGIPNDIPLNPGFQVDYLEMIARTPNGDKVIQIIKGIRN